VPPGEVHDGSETYVDGKTKKERVRTNEKGQNEGRKKGGGGKKNSWPLELGSGVQLDHVNSHSTIEAPKTAKVPESQEIAERKTGAPTK